MNTEISAIVIGALLRRRAKVVRSPESMEVRPLSLRRVLGRDDGGALSTFAGGTPVVSLEPDGTEAA